VRAGGSHYALFLLCGLVPWKWFASSVQNGSRIIEANSGLIQQVYLPKYVLPWLVLVTNGIKFIIILALLMLFTAASHGVSATWVALPALVLVELLLVLALSSLVAAVVPLLPDLDLVVSNGLIVMMFMSGIIKDVAELPPSVQAVLRFNPMVHVVTGFRDVLLGRRWPDWGSLAWVVAASLLLYGLALWLLRRYDRIYPKLMLG
jgi:lipopolysaccharide transport system permease protein